MAKRKRTPVVPSEKAPGAQLPEAPALPPITEHLKIEHQRFIETYLENGHNATRAYLAAYPAATYETAGVEGSKLLEKPKVKEWIDERRKQWAENFNYTREKHIRILTARATARAADFAHLSSFSSREDYGSLGDLEYAIKGWDSNGKPVLHDAGAAANELAKLLGHDKTSNGRDREAQSSGLLGRLSRLRGKRNGGGA